MKAAVDLHVHSSLSPCADEEMTPNNIVNMAILKGLDVLAVTDHNACDNFEAISKVASSKILIVPGIELQTSEELHLLCYFPSFGALTDFDREIRKHIPKILNNSEKFGFQHIFNEYDEIIGERKEALIVSVDMTLEKALHETRIRGGVPIPAHIDRKSFSIVSQLGFIPEVYDFKTLEISTPKGDCTEKRLKYLLKPQTQYIFSSDAHKLEDILERIMFLDVFDLTIQSILHKLKHG